MKDADDPKQAGERVVPDLLKLARECGGDDSYGLDDKVDMSASALAAFEARIRDDEREECARVCELERVEVSKHERGREEDRAYNLATKHCASAIRSQK